MEFDFDIIIIGAGPGGYVAAEKAGAQGAKVLLVEKEHLGGVCLNKGCIPTKTLLYSAKTFQMAQKSEAFGVTCSEVSYDIYTMMSRKDKVVETLRKGVGTLMRQSKVEVVSGEARLIDRQIVSIADKKYKAKNIIIATGSSCTIPPIKGVDSEAVLTSDDVVQLNEIPKSIIIIGAGVVGIEFASYYSMLGVKVSVIDILPEILSQFDTDIAKTVRQSMKDCKFHLGVRVQKIKDQIVTIEKNGKTESLKADKILMATGRNPNIDGLGLEELKIDVSPQGIVVNAQMQTNVPGIYAIGDVTGKSMLAHSASRMGEVAVNTIMGKTDQMRYEAIPWVVYGYPEVAGVGLTEAEAKQKNIPIKSQTVPLRINGRFLAENENHTGMCKLVVHQDTKALLGVVMIGSHCSEIIFGAAIMIEEEYRLENIEDIVFPHPTVSEIFKDAAWMLSKKI